MKAMVVSKLMMGIVVIIIVTIIITAYSVVKTAYRDKPYDFIKESSSTESGQHTMWCGGYACGFNGQISLRVCMCVGEGKGEKKKEEGVILYL